MEGTCGSSSPSSLGTNRVACSLGRGLRAGRSEVGLLQRDCRQTRALPHYTVVAPPDSAR